MDSSILKYDLLGPFEKKEVKDFIDFLFSKKQGSNSPQPEPSDYRKKILSVFTWSEKDIQAFEVEEIEKKIKSYPFQTMASLRWSHCPD